MLKKLFLLFCIAVLVTCEDRMKREKGRKMRNISFDTQNDDIGVSLDFSVPFLTIPYKKTLNSMLGGFTGLGIPKINFHPSALALGAAMVVATTLLIPFFSKGVRSQEDDRYYRDLKPETYETNIFTDLGQQLMSVSNGCPMRFACWISQRSNDGESRRTMEQIIRNKLVSSVVNTTSIEEAMRSGRKGHDCTIYEPCPIREDFLPVLMKNFAILTNSRNVT